jgi:hypothetical protein
VQVTDKNAALDTFELLSEWKKEDSIDGNDTVHIFKKSH